MHNHHVNMPLLTLLSFCQTSKQIGCAKLPSLWGFVPRFGPSDLLPQKTPTHIPSCKKRSRKTTCCPVSFQEILLSSMCHALFCAKTSPDNFVLLLLQLSFSENY